MRLELAVSDLVDLSSDGASVLPFLRVDGPAPRVFLKPPSALAPGAYKLSVRAKAEGVPLVLALSQHYAGGEASRVALREVRQGEWSALLTPSKVVSALALEVVQGEALVLGDVTVEFEDVETTGSPTIWRGFIELGRGVFGKLPLAWRRAVLASRARARLLRSARPSDEAPSPQSGRLIDPMNEASFQADFENRLAVARGVRRPAYVSAESDGIGHATVKPIAFYLPQFHPIPQNDAWWGKGFTEWSNVAKAIPQFVGHDQPRLPGELGFYDLRTPGIIAAQAQLARAFGLRGFCFHYYWFAGQRLLEAPLDAFLADASIDIGFCLCWANENWTRRWDGDDSEVLIAQQHSRDDHERVFDDICRYLEDSRYITIDGRPLVVVYRPDLIPDAAAMAAIWRERAARRGLPGLFLAATSAFRFDAPLSVGFDALIEFPPHGLVADRIDASLPRLNKAHAGAVYDYKAVARDERRRADAAHAGRFPIFPGVMPGWDNEARRPGAGVTYHGSTPEDYGRWLAAAVARAERTLPEPQRFVFINAWNEWAEGAYLEPDRAFGRAYLAETARVLSGVRATS